MVAWSLHDFDALIGRYFRKGAFPFAAGAVLEENAGF